MDRQEADRIFKVMSELAATMQANRSFLDRAVRYFLDHGVRQFLDLGSDIPTVGNVHEVAHEIDPVARVGLRRQRTGGRGHSEWMLAGIANATITHADLRHPDDVLNAPV